jgi:hypothetical protein
MEEKEKSVSLSAKDLKEIISSAVETAVKAAKAPNEIEQAQIDREKQKIAEANQSRLESAAQIRISNANDNFQKRACAHEGGRPKHPHTVFVSDDLGGYVLCQKCRAVIRPETQLPHFPAGFREKRPDVIFDTALFNHVFQLTDASGLFA